MKKKVKQEIVVEIAVCNICEKEINHRFGETGGQMRVSVVRQLFKSNDFDAHDSCINREIRQVFKKYFDTQTNQ